jgi:histidinol-phosphate aminotransferase
MTVTPAELIRPEILALQAYPVADAQGLIKLDAMENPYSWPDELITEWLATLRDTPLNRYPDSQARALVQQMRASLELPAEVELLLGNGSDELIQLLALTLAGAQGERRVVLAPEPSFVMYRMVATFTGLDYVGVPLRSDFSLDTAAMLHAIRTHRPALVFIAYPNNPTGNLFDTGALREIIAATPGLVVVDEAYGAFAEVSFINALAEYDNLLLMRTLSKLGLAGLRLGYVLGAAHWLREIDKLRLPYNINVLTQRSVEFVLRHQAVLEIQAGWIRQARTELQAELAQLPGIVTYPSQANFILFRVPEGQSGAVFNGLKYQGVLIKNLHPVGGLLHDCLRVTVGTSAENRRFLDALGDLL